jgi:beta-galactosidase/evolved beta-galactosidase subunit alpha
VTFSKHEGTIAAWHYGGVPLVKRGPIPQFWRAPIGNQRRSLAGPWREAGLDRLQCRTDAVRLEKLSDRAVRVTITQRVAPPSRGNAYKCILRYTVFGSGDVILDLQGVPQGEWPEMLPRMGFRVALEKALEEVTWYGRGPGECYVDSKEAALVGVYRNNVDGLFTPYVRPQENGNRTDVRWVTFTDRQGVGLLLVGAPVLNFSAHRFTTEDLDRAAHPHELVPRDFISLNVDDRHLGLGPDWNGPLPQHTLAPETFRFAVRLRALSTRSMSPTALSKLDLTSGRPRG